VLKNESLYNIIVFKKGNLGESVVF